MVVDLHELLQTCAMQDARLAGCCWGEAAQVKVLAAAIEVQRGSTSVGRLHNLAKVSSTWF